MLPDLGKYAIEVLSAYGVSLVLLALLVMVTLRRGRRARAQLQAAEQESTRHG